MRSPLPPVSPWPAPASFWPPPHQGRRQEKLSRYSQVLVWSRGNIEGMNTKQIPAYWWTRRGTDCLLTFLRMTNKLEKCVGKWLSLLLCSSSAHPATQLMMTKYLAVNYSIASIAPSIAQQPARFRHQTIITFSIFTLILWLIQNIRRSCLSVCSPSPSLTQDRAHLSNVWSVLFIEMRSSAVECLLFRNVDW